MPNVIVRPVLDRVAYRLPFHVRVSAQARADEVDRIRAWGLERMRTQLERQGWDFLMLSPERPRGPLPVVPLKGVGKRPAAGPNTPLAQDDSLWRISTLPQVLTDEVEWEYVAIFQRPVIPTASEELSQDA